MLLTPNSCSKDIVSLISSLTMASSFGRPCKGGVRVNVQENELNEGDIIAALGKTGKYGTIAQKKQKLDAVKAQKVRLLQIVPAELKSQLKDALESVEKLASRPSKNDASTAFYSIGIAIRAWRDQSSRPCCSASWFEVEPKSDASYFRTCCAKNCRPVSPRRTTQLVSRGASPQYATNDSGSLAQQSTVQYSQYWPIEYEGI